MISGSQPISHYAYLRAPKTYFCLGCILRDSELNGIYIFKKLSGDYNVSQSSRNANLLSKLHRTYQQVSWHPGVTKLANGCSELQISSSLEKTHLSQSCCPSRNQHPLHATLMPSCPECVVTAEHWCFRSQSSSSLIFRTQLKCHRPFLQLLRGHPFTSVVTGVYLHDSNIRVCFLKKSVST